MNTEDWLTCIKGFEKIVKMRDDFVMYCFDHGSKLLPVVGHKADNSKGKGTF